jgi:23S rRNA (uracil1939-C5)-methyltransferase
MTESKEFTVTLDRWAYGGEAMGRLPDGRAVFVPFSIPEETVQVRLVEEKRGFARGELLEIKEASPDRIEARCKHYRECGGCHYQHLPYKLQVQAKQEILNDQLARIGKLDPELVEKASQPMVSGAEEWHYRNNVQFHLDEQGRLGFQAPRSNRLVPIEECHLPEKAINRVWEQLDLEPVPDLRRVGLRVGVENEIMLILESDSDEGVEFELDVPMAAVQLGPNTTHVLSDAPFLTMSVLREEFRVSARAFFQVNTAMAEAMAVHIMEILPLNHRSVVLDAYCGAGLFSAFIAPKVAQLIGIELDPFAVDDFLYNLDAYEHVEVYQAPAEDVLPELDLHPDVVLVDPPRAGLGKEALDAILKMAPQTIAYVSCDPATLGRDAKRLQAGGYHLLQITPFDLFPQTYHIESISLWEHEG